MWQSDGRHVERVSERSGHLELRVGRLACVITLVRQGRVHLVGCDKVARTRVAVRQRAHPPSRQVHLSAHSLVSFVLVD